MLEKLNCYKTSRRMHLITLCAMFIVMLVFNILTQKIADDYMYSFSFSTGERVTGIGETVESMIAHGQQVNGRYFSHFIATLCLMLPEIVFDLLNSAVFVSVIYIIYRLCNKGRETDNIFLLAIFGFVWLFQHDFGQVNLWLDGSCNYLFAIFFSLLFIIPFFNSIMHKKHLHIALILPHVALSVWFGGYLEMTSAGFICAACLLVAADVFYFKNKRALTLLPSIAAAFVGFLIMALAPSQSANKLTEFSFINMLTTFGVALLVVASVFPIIIIYIILFKRALREGVSRRVLLTSLILAVGAMAANFVLVFARYYALRCSTAFIILSIFATALLWGNVKDHSISIRARKYCKIFVVVLALALVVGLVDNAVTFAIIEEHEQIISEALENGEREVTLYRPLPISKYNSVWGLTYLDIESPTNWPNNYFAGYYGLDSVTGKSIIYEWLGW